MNTMIQVDCAACAHKHLAAAYAAMTVAGTPAPAYVPPAQLFLARARVLAQEAAGGYPGNLALAVGCMAMAEALEPDPGLAGFWRGLRLQASEHGAHALLQGVAWTAAAAAGAHFTEALRECPELADRIAAGEWIGINGFNCDEPRRFLEILRKNLLWLEETYELGTRPAPEAGPAPEPAGIWFSSAELAGAAKTSHETLGYKGFDYRSFYNGFLEGAAWAASGKGEKV